MPLYDYRCSDCDHEIEVLQGMNDDPLTTCPECSKETLKKKMSAPAFTFKGGGWYKDLYSSADSGGSKSKPSVSADKPAVTEAPKSESKAAKAGD